MYSKISLNSTKKKILFRLVWYILGSFDRSAFRNVKIILNFTVNSYLKKVP